MMTKDIMALIVRRAATLRGGVDPHSTVAVHCLPVFFRTLTNDGQKLEAYPLDDDWKDISRINDLEAARAEFNSVFLG